MRDYKQFQEELRTTGRYATLTTQKPGDAPIRISAINSLLYAATIVKIVTRCALKQVQKRFNNEEWANTCMASITFAERLGGVVTFEGFEQRVDHQGPVVYVANHMSTMETMVFPTTLLTFGPIAIVLKKSLTDIPFVGKAAMHVGCFPVTRANPREDLKTVLEVGAQRIAAGHSVLLFPQGTRQAIFDAKKFNTLGAKLATRTGVPVVPLAVKTDFLQTGKWIKDFGVVDPNRPIRFACGPLLPPELGARAIHEKSVTFIEGKLREWGLPIATPEATHE